MSFLAKHILEILGSQIETKHAFNVVRVSIVLRLPLASGEHRRDHHYCEELT